jgi:hypothetical protein
MKQTAVDLFCTTIADHIEAVFNGSIQLDEFEKRMRQSYGQALELERQQIIDAYVNGNHSEMRGGKVIHSISEKYYTQTFTEPKND